MTTIFLIPAAAAWFRTCAVPWTPSLKVCQLFSASRNVGRAHINCLLRRRATHERSGHMDELVDTYHTDERLDWSLVNYCVPLKTSDKSEDAISATSTASKSGYFAKTFCRVATLAPRAEPLTR